MSQAAENRRLYERLVHEHAGALYRLAYRLCGRAAVAEDLVQETYYHAWRSIDALRDEGAGQAWLLQILRHRYAHHVRAERRRVRVVSDAELAEKQTEAGTDVVGLIANQELLQRALDGLRDEEKQPFLLVFAQGMKCREAAETLQLPLGTVLSRIHRARKALRARLRELDRELPGGEG